jgi:Na+/melibiose symporter-like transporter
MITLRFADVLPENGDPLLLRILIGNEMIRVAAGTIVGIMFVSMVADSLDAQELETGRRQEGVFSAAISFASKATSGVGVVFGGLILDYALAFPRGAKPGAVDANVIFELGLIAGILVPLLYLVPFWMTARYQITRAVHAQIQASLHERRSDIAQRNGTRAP